MYSIEHCSPSISSSSTTASSSSSATLSTPPSSPSSQRTSIPSSSSKSKVTPATRRNVYTTASISSYNNIFAFNPDDYIPSKVKKAARINTEYIDPMRVFYPPSKASPFCACGTHTLPDEAPAMSDAWGRDPVDSLRNSLTKLTPEVDDPPPFFLGYPAWYCDPSLRIAPTPLNSSTLEKGRTLYATGGGVALNGEEEEDDEDDEWHDAMSTSEAATLLSSATELDSFARAGTRVIAPLQKNAELSSTSSMFGAPAEIQEAHWLYHQTFADKAQAPRVVLADLIEMNLRRTAMVGLLKMKTTLFGQRSDIWKVVECSAHPNQCSCGYYLTSLHLDGDGLGDGSSYGHPARRLGAFAGALFALDILSFSDFRTCIDILRTKTGCVAAQALHAAVLHAGDKVCKTKNREYMLELAEEQRRRLSMPWIESDRGARDLLNQIIMRIDEYLDSQVGKQAQATTKSPPRRRGQKISLGSWGRM